MKMKQFAIIGLGRFGSALGAELIQQGLEVMGIDKDEEVVDDMADKLTHVIAADCTDEETLKAIGIRNFDCVIVAIGDDIQSSILTTLLLKDLGVKMVVAKALSELHGKVLERIGVDRVIFPEREMGIRVAHQLTSPNLLDYIELSKEYSIAELSVPKCMDGRSLKDLDPRARHGCSVVAINKKSGVVIAPSADDVLAEKDVMVIIGTNKQIEHFEQELVNR